MFPSVWLRLILISIAVNVHFIFRQWKIYQFLNDNCIWICFLLHVLTVLHQYQHFCTVLVRKQLKVYLHFSSGSFKLMLWLHPHRLVMLTRAATIRTKKENKKNKLALLIILSTLRKLFICHVCFCDNLNLLDYIFMLADFYQHRSILKVIIHVLHKQENWLRFHCQNQTFL